MFAQILQFEIHAFHLDSTVRCVETPLQNDVLVPHDQMSIGNGEHLHKTKLSSFLVSIYEFNIGGCALQEFDLVLVVVFVVKLEHWHCKIVIHECLIKSIIVFRQI